MARGNDPLVHFGPLLLRGTMKPDPVARSETRLPVPNPTKGLNYESGIVDPRLDRRDREVVGQAGKVCKFCLVKSLHGYLSSF